MESLYICSEINGIAERAVRRIREGTSARLPNEACEDWRCGGVLPAESALPMCVTTPVVEAPCVVVEHQPIPVTDYATPAPALSNATLALVVEHIAPVPVDTSSTPVCVGDTGLDTWWEAPLRGYSHWRPPLRGRDPRPSGKNPEDVRSGRWIPNRCCRPDGKRARLRSCALWENVDGVRDGDRRPGPG